MRIQWIHWIRFFLDALDPFSVIVLIIAVLCVLFCILCASTFLTWVFGMLWGSSKAFVKCAPETCANFLFSEISPLEKFPIVSQADTDTVMFAMQKHASTVSLRCSSAKHVGVLRNAAFVDSTLMFNIRGNNSPTTTLEVVSAKIGTTLRNIRVPIKPRYEWVYEDRDGKTQKFTATSDSDARCMEVMSRVLAGDI